MPLERGEGEGESGDDGIPRSNGGLTCTRLESEPEAADSFTRSLALLFRLENIIDRAGDGDFGMNAGIASGVKSFR